MSEQRFIRIDEPERYDLKTDEDTAWWFDLRRPIRDKDQPFIAVQTDAEKDANDFVPHKNMRLLFTDQAEYCAVCGDCYLTYSNMQWSGGTRGGANWREKAARFLENHEKTKGWCQFCDPVFGNGGWHIGPGDLL